MEELQDLKGVWSELSKIWQKIDELKEKPWMAVAPRKVRAELDGLLEMMKGMPSHLKSYASYDFVQRMIKGYLKVSGGVTPGAVCICVLVVRHSWVGSAAVWCAILAQVNIYVTELKSEALKERHWKDLMRRLRVRWVMTDLTLGQVWDVDLQRNEAVVKDVILVAQGEMGLEVFLRQVRWGGQSQGVILTCACPVGYDLRQLHCGMCGLCCLVELCDG